MDDLQGVMKVEIELVFQSVIQNLMSNNSSNICFLFSPWTLRFNCLPHSLYFPIIIPLLTLVLTDMPSLVATSS